MTSINDPKPESFQLSQLINDTRYRSYTFQFIALIVLFFLVGYLYLNLVENLRTAGLDISYEFLGEPAGYDINQRLVEYNSQSSHWRASVVGVLNTYWLPLWMHFGNDFWCDGGCSSPVK